MRKKQKTTIAQVPPKERLSCGFCGIVFHFFSEIKKLIRFCLKQVKWYIMPRGLFYRFVLIILLPLILLQASLFLFFYERHWDTVSRRLARDVAGEIQAVADFVVHQASSEENVQALLDEFGKSLGLKMTFYPHESFTISKISYQGESSQLASIIQEGSYAMEMRQWVDQSQQIRLQLPTGVLEVIVPRKRFFSSTVSVFVIWMIGSSILLFWIAFLFMRNQVRSIQRLSEASELFGLGHDIAFKPGGATEVRQAGYSFILMKNRIQKYLSERTAMLAGVSHDLRTPLTRMKLQLSMMPNDETSADLLSDVSEMEQMLNGYLAFARGEGKEAPQEIALDELVAELVEKQRKAEQRIDYHTEEHICISGRLNEISRAITNILTNAGRYAKQTNVSVGERNHVARVVIDDNGPGIPESKRQEVFKAFYRLESSRNKATGGIGLGMTITRDIILSHGGEIELSDSPLGGLRVIMTFPALVEPETEKKQKNNKFFKPKKR